MWKGLRILGSRAADTVRRFQMRVEDKEPRDEMSSRVP